MITRLNLVRACGKKRDVEETVFFRTKCASSVVLRESMYLKRAQKIGDVPIFPFTRIIRACTPKNRVLF